MSSLSSGRSAAAAASTGGGCMGHLLYFTKVYDDDDDDDDDKKVGKVGEDAKGSGQQQAATIYHYRMTVDPRSLTMTDLRLVDKDEMVWVRSILTSSVVRRLERTLVELHLGDPTIDRYSVTLPAEADSSSDLPRLTTSMQSIYFSKSFADDPEIRVKQVYFRCEIQTGSIQLRIVRWREKQAVERLVKGDVVADESAILAGRRRTAADSRRRRVERIRLASSSSSSSSCGGVGGGGGMQIPERTQRTVRFSEARNEYY